MPLQQYLHTRNALLYLVWLMGSFLMMPVYAEKSFQENVHYDLIKPPKMLDNPDKVEVLEVFSYACPHCFRFEPAVHKWLQNKPAQAEFKRMPVLFVGRHGELLARAYYIADALGVEKKISSAIFNTLHVKRERISNKATLKNIFVAQGVSAKDFDAMYDSFAVDSGLRKSKMMTSKLGITGVPTIVVQGKYRTAPSRVSGGNNAVFALVNNLVEKETVKK